MSFPTIGPHHVAARMYDVGWGLAYLYGSKIPGRIKITGGGIRSRLDEQKAGGKNSGKRVGLGVDFEPFTLEVNCFTDEQIKELQRIVDEVQTVLWAEPAAQFKFQCAYVPGTAFVNVKAISSWEDSPSYRGRVRKFVLQHWKAPEAVETVKAKKKQKPATRQINNAITEEQFVQSLVSP